MSQAKLREALLNAAWRYTRSPQGEYERGRYEAALDMERAIAALSDQTPDERLSVPPENNSEPVAWPYKRVKGDLTERCS